MSKDKDSIDYHEFYNGLIEGEYLPLRIDPEWLKENEEYVREVLFEYYHYFTNGINSDKDRLKGLYKLFGAALMHTYIHFKNFDLY